MLLPCGVVLIATRPLVFGEVREQGMTAGMEHDSGIARSVEDLRREPLDLSLPRVDGTVGVQLGGDRSGVPLDPARIVRGHP